jgi:selenocysteine lyase/cysteine desulfurase
MQIQAVRELFPYLKTNKIYFNHASTSPYSLRVTDAIQNFVKMRSEGDIDDVELILKAFLRTKNKLADLLNASSDAIAFVDNTSNGLNILAQGLNLKKGDGILLNDLEFPSNVYPFLNLRKNGVEINFVKSKNGIVTAEDIINGVKPNTKLISVSFVQFLTGYRVDLEKIGEFCRRNNIIFCVDAIQGLPAIRLNVEKYNIDFISCGTWKWFMAMQGFAFIYVSKDLQERLEQKFVGWTSVENAWDLLNYDLKFRNSAERYQNGTQISMGAIILDASLSLFKDFGYNHVEEVILNNSEYLISELIELGISPVLAGVERNNLSGIVSFKTENSESLFKELEKNNIKCALREGIIRFSPHFYNTSDEINKVVDFLTKLVSNHIF